MGVFRTVLYGTISEKNHYSVNDPFLNSVSATEGFVWIITAVDMSAWLLSPKNGYLLSMFI